MTVNHIRKAWIRKNESEYKFHYFDNTRMPLNPDDSLCLGYQLNKGDIIKIISDQNIEPSNCCEECIKLKQQYEKSEIFLKALKEASKNTFKTSSEGENFSVTTQISYPGFGAKILFIFVNSFLHLQIDFRDLSAIGVYIENNKFIIDLVFKNNTLKLEYNTRYKWEQIIKAIQENI